MWTVNLVHHITPCWGILASSDLRTLPPHLDAKCRRFFVALSNHNNRLAKAMCVKGRRKWCDSMIKMSCLCRQWTVKLLPEHCVMKQMYFGDVLPGYATCEWNFWWITVHTPIKFLLGSDTNYQKKRKNSHGGPLQSYQSFLCWIKSLQTQSFSSHTTNHKKKKTIIFAD